MFGHDDKDEKQEEPVTAEAGSVVQPISTTPPDDNLVGASSTATAPVTPASDDDGDINKIVDDINASTDAGESTSDQPKTSETESAPAVEPTPEVVTESEPEERPEEPNVGSVDEPTLSETPAELLEVKKSALQELSPLLDELDQPADEKLDILMMTIQATDDQALLPQALETAKKIEDKKARAEAMLDIIQEINYFTKKQ